MFALCWRLVVVAFDICLNKLQRRPQSNDLLLDLSGAIRLPKRRMNGYPFSRVRLVHHIHYECYCWQSNQREHVFAHQKSGFLCHVFSFITDLRSTSCKSCAWWGHRVLLEIFSVNLFVRSVQVIETPIGLGCYSEREILSRREANEVLDAKHPMNNCIVETISSLRPSVVWSLILKTSLHPISCWMCLRALWGWTSPRE